MNTTIEMAKEAGFKEHNGLIYVTTINDDCAKELKAFADLVRADERNRTWTQEHWTEYERSIAAQERDACAKVCEQQSLLQLDERVMRGIDACTAAIRARDTAA